MKNLKTKLKQAITEEENILDTRFKNAKAVFDGMNSSKKIYKERPVTKSFTLLKEEINLLETLRIEYAKQGKLVCQSDIIKMSLRALSDLGEDKYVMLAKINK